MELNLFINIFKKQPGNVPPRRVMSTDMAWSSKGRVWENKGFFCCQVLFSPFQKNKNSQEILPVWYSHHCHDRLNTRPLLPVSSTLGWSRIMPTSDLTGMPQIEMKLYISLAEASLYCLDSMQLPIPAYLILFIFKQRKTQLGPQGERGTSTEGPAASATA